MGSKRLELFWRCYGDFSCKFWLYWRFRFGLGLFLGVKECKGGVWWNDCKLLLMVCVGVFVYNEFGGLIWVLGS